MAETRDERVLRTAVIGLGRIGWQYHVPQVSAHRGFQLVAVVEPLPDRRHEACAAYGARGYADCDALLGAESLNLVVIASPTRFHADQAIAAFEHGCDVLCDKPMAPSLAECDRMISAMRAHGRKLMVYQPHRARAEVTALRQILREGLIGSVYMIKRAVSTYTRRNDWQAFRKHGGGMLNNSGAHYIDQLLYLVGSRAKRVAGVLRTVASLGDAEDVVKALIETEDGTILDLDINMASAHGMVPWQVLGEYGSIVLDVTGEAFQVRYVRPEELAVIGIDDGLAAPERRYGSGETIPWREATYLLAAFEEVDFYAQCYEYYALDGEPYVPVDETREVMRVIDLCRKWAK